MFLNIIKQIGIFIMIVIIQLFLLNNIVIGSRFAYLFQPQLIVMYLLFMPIGISQIKMTISAFIAGIMFDLFFNSWGIHAFVATFIGFTRYYVTAGIENTISARDEDRQVWTSKKSQSWKWTYFLSFIFIYHFLFIMIETLGRNFFTAVLPSVLISSLSVFVIILILENLLFRPSKN
ncbi:MAG: rod shape-determining protein MreD [Bacteroidota bacterium]|nr:rod shape-determining protein MreD [Bacteroidota bacterium]